MAKAPAKPDAEATEAAPPAKSKKLLIIIIVAVLLLVVAGAAVALLMMKNSKGAEEGAEAHDNAPPKVKVDRTKPPTFVPLDAFTVNLQRGEGDHYLQAVIVLKVSEPQVGEDLKAYMPEIRHRVNLLLSSKLPSDIADVEGRELLAEEVMIEANFVLGYEPPPKKKSRRSEPDPEPWGPVLAVLFNSFIIQ